MTDLTGRRAVVTGAASGIGRAIAEDFPEDRWEELIRIMLAPAAIKRLLEPSEVAAYVTFPCSEQAAGITGTAQVIDCGWAAR